MQSDPTFTTRAELDDWIWARRRMMTAARAIKNHSRADKHDADIKRVRKAHAHLLEGPPHAD